MLRRLLPLGFILLFAPAALGQADFEDVVCFGDSLTHNDLLWIAYGTPPDLYEADPMEAVFNKGAESGDQLASYAVAGSESSDVSYQVDLYLFFRLIGAQDAASLYCFEIGGNDILNNDGILAASPPGQDPAADAVIDNLISNIKNNLMTLWLSNMNAQFVIWTVPDVTLTPDLWHLSPGQAANLRAHVERANNFIRSLRHFPNVVVYDLYRILQMIVANPPVLYGHQLVPPPAHGDYDHLFADELHPTAVSNAYIANGMIIMINRKWNDGIPKYTNAELADLAHIPH